MTPKFVKKNKMKNINSYLKSIGNNIDGIQTLFSAFFEILLWGYFAVLHFIFFEELLFLPQVSSPDFSEGRYLQYPFPLNQVIFGGILFVIFQIVRILVNILTKRILFNYRSDKKFIIILTLMYVCIPVAFSSSIIICKVFLIKDSQFFFNNNLDSLYRESPELGYLNPIVNSFYYFIDFILFIFNRIDFILFFILQFGFNLLAILFPFLNKIRHWKLKKTLTNKSNLDQIAIYGAIQHELGNKLPTLKIDLEALNLFLKNESNSANLLIEHPIRKKEFEGDYVESVGSLIERVFAKVDYCINATANLNGFINADPNKFKPEKVKLIEFFEQEAFKYLENQPNIILKFDGNRNAEAYIDKKQFSTLLLNVISNAIRHGFTEFEKKYSLSFIVEDYRFSDFNGKFSKSIKIINNGNPFPKSINKEDYGTAMKYGGNTGNSGYGGFLISKIIENHSGEFDIFDGNLNSENVGVGIIIYLP